MITRRRMIHNLVDMVASGIAPLTITNARELVGVKLFGKCEQRNDLPSGYTEFEYIEFDGTQYINTSIMPTSNTEIEMAFTITAGMGYSTNGSNSSANGMYLLFSPANANMNTKVTTLTYIANAKNTIIQNKNNVTLNGNIINYNGTVADFVGSDPLWIGGGTSFRFKGRIYSWIIRESGLVVQNLIPAKNSSNVLGMYDTVTGTFFTNQGTGTFIAGPEVVPTPDKPIDIWCNNGVLKARHQSGLPLGYTLLDYIESSGTQYINLGISGDGNIVIDAQCTNIGTASCILFGTRSGDAGTWYGKFAGYTNWSIGPFETCISTIPCTNRATATLSFSSTGIDGYVDGEHISRAANTIQGPWTLFAGSTMVYPFCGRVFSFKGYINNVMVRHLLPVKQLSDNIIGMYDLVTDTFFTNAGTGDFIAGNEINDPIYTEGTAETISIHGKNIADGFYPGIVTANKVIITNTNKIQLPYTSTRIYEGIAVICKVTSGKEYIYSSDLNTTYVSVGFFENIEDVTDTNKVHSSLAIKSTKRFTVPQGMNYAVVLFCDQAIGTQYNFDRIQVEQGSTATAYEPYYDGDTATATNLLQVGDYKDVQDIISGIVTRRVGVMVFDGTEDWSRTDVRTCLTLPNSKQTSGNLEIYCTHYKGYLGSIPIASMPDNSCKINITTQYLLIKDSMHNTSLEMWKAYLANQYAAGTPVIIIYPLATETTESVTPQTLVIQPGTNVFEITQASIDDLSMEVDYKGIR